MNIEIFKITGISPLLMNNPSSMPADEDKATTATKKKVSPEEEAAASVYSLDTGQLFIPCLALRSSLWYGSAYQKLGKYSARSRIDAGVFVIEEESPLVKPGTKKPIKEYDIDARTVVIKATKGRILRHRPKVKEWECYLPLEVDTDFITSDQILSLFNQAGKVAGVLDYRPNCHGPFGRYGVELQSNGNKKIRNKIG